MGAASACVDGEASPHLLLPVRLCSKPGVHAEKPQPFVNECILPFFSAGALDPGGAAIMDAGGHKLADHDAVG